MTRQEKRSNKDLVYHERNKELQALLKQKQEKLKGPAQSHLPAGLVVANGAGSCIVETREGSLSCVSMPGVAIGDRVRYDPVRHQVREILPRRTVLSRPDPANHRVERVIAANVDLVVVVATLRSPDFRPGLVDRFLIAIERGEAHAALCINKCDLAVSEADYAPLEEFWRAGIPVVTCSASSGAGLDSLRTLLAGNVCVFAGHSGVGKSSLLNALKPGLGLLAKPVSAGNNKGRHTTTTSSLYDLGDGARVIDTPGIREFGLWNMSADEVRFYFHEFDRWAGRCKFRDCSHSHEPQCAVRDAAERGDLPADRYRRYCRLLEDGQM